MVAPERLAKVAEAAREVRIGPFGPNARETINRGGVTHLNGSEREALAQALAPLLDEFQAEDEARSAARVREAVEALAELTEGPLRVGTNLWSECDRDAYSLAIEEAQAVLRNALDAAEKAEPTPLAWTACDGKPCRFCVDAAEKAAVGGVAGAESGEDGFRGAEGTGPGENAADRHTAAQEGICGVPFGDGYACDLPKGHA